MRVLNNTDVDTEFMLELNKHLIFTQLDTKLIESITFNDKSMDIFGVDCLLATILYNKDLKLKGKVRWFDKSGGVGSIRLERNDCSARFYACNVVGANSLYEFLVTNVDLKEGDKVEVTVACDSFTFKALGFTKVQKVS